MFNEKNILYVIKSITLLYFCIIFSSCSEDILTSNNPTVTPIVDSLIFDVHRDTINAMVEGFAVIDSNYYFAAAYPNAYTFKNGQITYYSYNDNSFNVRRTIVFDDNHIYITGSEDKIGGKSKLKLFYGNTINDIPLPNDSSQGISDIEILNPNEFYIITDKSHIYHYLNGIINTTPFDTNIYYAGELFKCNNNDLITVFSDKTHFGEFNVLHYFKLSGSNNWNKIKSDTINNGSEIFFVLNSIDGKLIRYGHHGLYFNSIDFQTWNRFIDFGQYEPVIRFLDGTALNNMLFLEEGTYGACYFNGEKIFSQHIFGLEHFIRNVLYKNNMFYIVSVSTPFYGVVHRLSFKNPKIIKN